MPETNSSLPSGSWMSMAGMIFILLIMVFVFIAVIPNARKDSQQNLRTANQYTNTSTRATYGYAMSTQKVKDACRKKARSWVRSLGYTGPIATAKQARYVSLCVEEKQSYLDSILGEVFGAPTYYN
jgi:hypothetical protein